MLFDSVVDVEEHCVANLSRSLKNVRFLLANLLVSLCHLSFGNVLVAAAAALIVFLHSESLFGLVAGMMSPLCSSHGRHSVE